MGEGYFRRVAKLSPTRFWINNPTREEADLALAAGATGCTLNPSYTQKMLDHPEEGHYAVEVLDATLGDLHGAGATAVIAEYQRRMAAPIASKFMQLFDETKGEHGYVSIQADPVLEDDAAPIVSEGRLNRSVSPNVCCKIPVTPPGLEAIETLLAEGTNINATEIFAIAQGVALGELYEKVVPRGRRGPRMWYSHIAGIYDDFLAGYAKERGVDVPPDLLAQAGLAVSKKLYGIAKERGYRMSFIGGGARQTWHFTELVGGDVNLTINWKGTADKLLEADQPVVWRMFNPLPQVFVDELRAKLPDFARGWDERGLDLHDFEDFGPVGLFRGSFVASWKRVLGIIEERKASKGRR